MGGGKTWSISFIKHSTPQRGEGQTEAAREHCANRSSPSTVTLATSMADGTACALVHHRPRRYRSGSRARRACGGATHQRRPRHRQAAPGDRWTTTGSVVRRVRRPRRLHRDKPAVRGCGSVAITLRSWARASGGESTCCCSCGGGRWTSRDPTRAQGFHDFHQHQHPPPRHKRLPRIRPRGPRYSSPPSRQAPRLDGAICATHPNTTSGSRTAISDGAQPNASAPAAPSHWMPRAPHTRLVNSTASGRASPSGNVSANPRWDDPGRPLPERAMSSRTKNLHQPRGIASASRAAARTTAPPGNRKAIA